MLLFQIFLSSFFGPVHLTTAHNFIFCLKKHFVRILAVLLVQSHSMAILQNFQNRNRTLSTDFAF